MSRGIRAGRMKDRLSIQTATIVAGEYGGQDPTWTTTATRKCDIRPPNHGCDFRSVKCIKLAELKSQPWFGGTKYPELAKIWFDLEKEALEANTQ